MPDTRGTLTFFQPESWPIDQRPYELLFQPPDSEFLVSNYDVVQVPDILIRDVRLLQDELSLDPEGFLVAIFDTVMAYEDYFDQEKLKSIYAPEIKLFLKEKLGVRAAYIHECVIRQFGTQTGQTGAFGQPIPNVHTDYTHDYALELLQELTGYTAQAEEIKKSRVQMLNVWKPLKGPVRSWALALCDLQSLDRDDLVIFDEVHATAVLNSQQVKYNASQKWYYLSDQEASEILVFKSMDSVVRGEGLSHIEHWLQNPSLACATSDYNRHSTARGFPQYELD